NDATSKTGVSSDTIPGNYKLATVSKDNGVHMTNANPNLDFDAADPYMVKSDDNYYYVYSTDEGCHRSKDLNTWEVCDGTISGKPAETDYVWTPKVYQINGRYYMFASFIHWGRGYPYCANSWGFVGVAVADRLNEGFKYLGSIDSKISTLRLGQQSCGNGDPYHDNYNFIDGNLLIDSKYYFYYKVEQSQNIYAIQLAYDPSVSSHFRTVSSSPTWILRKNNTDSDTWGNGVSESPMVWRHHGYYSMTYSSGNYKGDGYPSGIYASGYAWASSPLSYWTNQSTDEKAPFLMGANTFFVNGGMYGGQNNPGTSGSIYAPGAVMVYRAYDDNRGNTSEWYGVYHSGHYDDSNLFDYRKLNFQRMGTSDGAVYINGVNNNYQPLISGTVYEGESYAQLRDESMTISTDGTEVRDYLYDGAIFNANSGLKSWSVPKVSNVSEITIKFKERYDLTDIWISTDGASLAGNSAIVYVNESGEQPYYFIVSDFKNLLGDNAYKKLQLPNSASVSGGYKEIRIHFTKPVNLTEVTPIRRISSVAENTLTSGAGLVVKNTSTVGYAKIAPTTTKTSEPAKSEEASKEKLEEDLSSKSEEVAKRELEEGSSNDMARGESFSDSGNDEEISPSVAVVTNTDIDTDTDVNIDTAVTAEDNGTDQLIFDCAENENCVLNRVAGGKVISEMELEATGSEQTSPVSGKLNEYLEEDNASMLDIILFVLCIGVIIALIVLICVFKRIQKQSQGRIY
ncbi:MAG: family 43 glycosylhydrolase, partial [Candidatus Saccharibacteria bacterium]|nr:family 43 glycosylhydrolase [Candidatus Saccharibacteria bacterium]